jgi:hypothetical protein
MPGRGFCAAVASEDMPMACPVEMSMSHSSTPCTSRTDVGLAVSGQSSWVVVPVRKRSRCAPVGGTCAWDITKRLKGEAVRGSHCAAPE